MKEPEALGGDKFLVDFNVAYNPYCAYNPNWSCPLTPFENWLRVRGGASAYDTGFLEHYLLPILYPVAMTRDVQVATGGFVVVVNVLVYWRVFRRWRRSRAVAGTGLAARK